MSKFLRLLSVITIVAIAPGCAAFVKALPQIVSLVNDAVLVIEQIESFSQSYFRAHPDAAREAAVADALARTRSALIATERAASGVEAVSKEDTQAALDAFREAYGHLLEAIGGIPGLRVGSAGDAAAPGELVVPDPLLLTHQLER